MVGLFGGSFDPIHHGHLILARIAMESLGLDEVRFLPAREQPFKVGQHGAGAEDRARMLELATEGAEGFGVDRMELSREGPSFTVDTLRTLVRESPDIEPVLLLGADAMHDFPKWREVDEVRRLARVAVFDRPDGLPVTEAVWRRVPAPLIDISSTAIRQRVRDGQSIRYWVPDAVAQYIAAHGLYQDGVA
ncbi:MAG TPA: nicotinate-nucleotide adenylyltransferase [Gemmatimonadales bacterium]|nr:nicotinate-nucleotide adenylyltransferase [Gemmatimonadales bacterium]